MAAKKEQSPLTKTSQKVGKALARSSHTVEKTGEKLKKAAKKLVKEATHKVEETVEQTVSKVKKEVDSLTKKKAGGAAAKNSSPKPAREISVESSIGFLAGDIFQYLSSNGTTSVEKIIKTMKARKNNESLINAALGWLAREAKISFSKDGKEISVL
ncbi:winged helix-turn-helix domain-containing protein [Thiovibrio sp. JS02]